MVALLSVLLGDGEAMQQPAQAQTGQVARHALFDHAVAPVSLDVILDPVERLHVLAENPFDGGNHRCVFDGEGTFCQYIQNW